MWLLKLFRREDKNQEQIRQLQEQERFIEERQRLNQTAEEQEKEVLRLREQILHKRRFQ